MQILNINIEKGGTMYYVNIEVDGKVLRRKNWSNMTTAETYAVYAAKFFTMDLATQGDVYFEGIVRHY